MQGVENICSSPELRIEKLHALQHSVLGCIVVRNIKIFCLKLYAWNLFYICTCFYLRAIALWFSLQRIFKFCTAYLTYFFLILLDCGRIWAKEGELCQGAWLCDCRCGMLLLFFGISFTNWRDFAFDSVYSELLPMFQKQMMLIKACTQISLDKRHKVFWLS